MTRSLPKRLFALITAFGLVAAPALCTAGCLVDADVDRVVSDVMLPCHADSRHADPGLAATGTPREAPTSPSPRDIPSSLACCSDDGKPLVQTQEPELPRLEPVFFETLHIETIFALQRPIQASRATKMGRPPGPYQEINPPLLT